MIKSEVSKLLVFISVIDKRTIGETDVEAWFEILPNDVLLADALDGVKTHFRESSKFLTPNDVIQRSLAAAAARIRKAGAPDFPPNLSWEQERQWRQLWSGLVNSGHEAEKAKAIADAQMNLPRRAELVIKPADVRLAIEGMFQGPRQRPVYNAGTDETATDLAYGACPAP